MDYKLTDWMYRKTKNVHSRILKRDIERGVKFLSDMAYSTTGGSTRGSATFLLELKKYIDLGKVYRADLTQDTKHWYTVKLFTTDGYTIMLKGLSFDYMGEGSRGCYAALRECGFDEKKIRTIFNHLARKRIRFYKRVA